jgi:hypothetical protein
MSKDEKVKHTVVRFNGIIPGTKPSDIYPTELLRWQKELLLEVAASLVWRKEHGTITSPELAVLDEIMQAWPSHFEATEKVSA